VWCSKGERDLHNRASRWVSLLGSVVPAGDVHGKVHVYPCDFGGQDCGTRAKPYGEQLEKGQ
jgi:hypothetical protein